ncbi:MAG: DUF4349 domain-containing protein, partial [Anaerolineae bacterium]|nr:DUF4349 domain-containing protein [Anaerolineae bacterium]
MKKFSPVLYFIMIFILLMSACAPAASSVASMDQAKSMAEAPAMPAAVAPMIAPAPAAEAYDANGVSGSGVDNASEIKRIVIKNASLSIVVIDPSVSMSAIGKMAEDMGGFIVNTNIYKTTTREGIEVPQADISIRVPAERLTEAIDKIKTLVSDPATGVTMENVSGSDVTKEYTDLQSRLTNLEKAADQLTEIMKDARKTEDVMSVYNQLMQINEQIE